MIGFHSVIDSPLSVSRVIPPTTTMTKISAQMLSSQLDTASGRARDGTRAGAFICGRHMLARTNAGKRTDCPTSFHENFVCGLPR
ncbi:hypothetical protein GCM10022211_22370 [Sphingomonas humi]|uniref:Uncharacterized protein n=1 Tax=Sphingomonas humi TaxID=335630 RepID=A0ABP7S9M9_9SPHN